MEPSDGNKPGKTSSSGEYSLMLGQTLRKEDKSKRQSARKAFERARQSCEPSAGDSDPPFVAPHPPIVPRGPLATDPEIPAAKEVKAATIALTESVDQICEGLVLVFGEMKLVTSTLAAITRVLLLLMIGQLIAFGFMGYMVWRLEAVVVQAEQTRKEQAHTASEIVNLKRSSEATKRSVEQVRVKAEEAPKVEIIADENKGTAVVRILPPATKGGELDATPAVSVDIPLDLDAARTTRPPSGKQR